MKHYLLSMPLGSDVFMHCYVMSNDKGIVEQATNKMVYETEKLIGEPVPVPVVLATPLGAANVKLIRRVLIEEYPKAAAQLEEATDFHITIWGMARSAPNCIKLMAMH